MNLKLLLDFLALIEEGSFTTAAQRRNVTQPAFSRRIQTLEDWLGHPLVKRSGRHIHVTEAALSAEAKIRSLVNQFQGLKRHVDLASTQKVHVVLTMPHTLSMFLFGEIVQGLGAQRQSGSAQSEFKFSLKSEYKSESLAIFLRGDADIFICNEEAGQTSIPGSFQCQSAVLGRDRIIPVAQTEWWKSVGREGTVLDSMPIIAYPEDSYLWQIVSRYSLPSMLEENTVVTEFETALSGGVKDLVARGLGVGWLPESYAAQELSTGHFMDLSGRFGHGSLELVCYLSQSSADSGCQEVFSRIQRLGLSRLA